MPRKTTLLNVRKHLEHCEMIFEGLKKYGWCPALQQEVNTASLIGRSIMRKHDEKRKAGNRKDITPSWK
jgi:hypothetical protein